MTNSTRLTLISATLFTAIFAASANANTADLFGEQNTAKSATPLESVELAANNNEYYRCARFSNIVLNACIADANRQKRSTKPCMRHYQQNIVRCQKLIK